MTIKGIFLTRTVYNAFSTDEGQPCLVYSGSRVLFNHDRNILVRPERTSLLTLNPDKLNLIYNHWTNIMKTKHTFLSQNVIKTQFNAGSISKYCIFHWEYPYHVVLFCGQKLHNHVTAASAFDIIYWILWRYLNVDQWLCGILIIWCLHIQNGLLMYPTYLK